MPVILQEPVVRRYTAQWCSPVGCFTLACFVGVLVVPFYAAFSTGDFWLRTRQHSEQPVVWFQHQVIFEAVTQLHDATTDTYDPPRTVGWSSVPDVQRVYESILRAPTIRAWPEHTNADTIPDLWRVQLELPLQKRERVLGVRMASVFSLSLTKRLTLDTESLVMLEHTSPVAGSGLGVDTVLGLRQAMPLPLRNPIRATPLLGSSIKNELDGLATGLSSQTSTGDAPPSASQLLLNQILVTNAERNVTFRTDDLYKVWVNDPDALSDRFCVNMTVRVRDLTVDYIAGAPELLKWAWVQVRLRHIHRACCCCSCCCCCCQYVTFASRLAMMIRC
jgi:hypothetical protein